MQSPFRLQLSPTSRRVRSRNSLQTSRIFLSSEPSSSRIDFCQGVYRRDLNPSDNARVTDWDERYRQGEHTTDQPHPLITRFSSTLAPGRVLDLASGPGRHAMWLAERGWQVTAVDYSRTAIEILRQRCLAKGLAVNSVIADLERHEFGIPPESYDLIIVCNYLQRDLFAPLKAGTRIGGTAMAVIALVDGDPNVRPMNPSYLLNPGELQAQFQEWEIVHSFEGKSPADAHPRATAEIVARRRY
ncbi:MAG: hypothetical protein DMG16_13975 [Acidobacteria bacterium]|nr:MAG: hypothetical protein DMG16_13975 [Acidobacteriota bacterium]